MHKTARFSIVMHRDDAEREFAYEAGAEKSLTRGQGIRLTVASNEGRRLQGGV